MIVYNCHICRTRLSSEDAQAGQLVRCPTCMTTLRVPAGELPVAAPAVVSKSINFTCNSCGATMSASHLQIGQVVRCPACMTTLRVPAMETVGAGALVGAAQGSSSSTSAGPVGPFPPRIQFKQGTFGGKRYGFNCGYCSSRLEATEAMAAQEGQCPTCGNQITIPIQDRYGRLIDPKTRQIIKQDPHPVHAYAAAGDRAPKIQRGKDGRQFIICPRCNINSPITANNCKNCGMPFTMEGTTLEAPGSSNGFCMASLVLGIVSIPGSCMFGIPAALAVIFGIVGIVQTQRTETSPAGAGRGLAIAGVCLGVIGGFITCIIYNVF